VNCWMEMNLFWEFEPGSRYRGASLSTVGAGVGFDLFTGAADVHVDGAQHDKGWLVHAGASGRLGRHGSLEQKNTCLPMLTAAEIVRNFVWPSW
jgi:hypothetical protein